METKIEKFLNNLPLLHSWDDYKTVNHGGLHKDFLQFIYQKIKFVEKKRIIETGAGLSTILFLLSNPEKQITINKDYDGFRKRFDIQLNTMDIETKNFEYINDLSENCFLDLIKNKSNRFNIALIDGSHTYFNVFCDFHYIDQMLDDGGVLFIDDTCLSSVDLLKNVIIEEPNYKFNAEIGKLACFTKLYTENKNEWIDFNYIHYVTQ
jgi:predicted O-methyltransferase YrrM